MVMNALVAPRYGRPDVVELRNLAVPEPGPREMVVDVRATTVNSGDARLRAARFPDGMACMGRLIFGWSAPKRPVLGAELAGVVTAVGQNVTEYAPGDRVLAMTGMRMGAHAQRCALDVDHCVVPLPDAVGFEEAVTLPFGGTTALTYLADRAALEAGERVLVIGASGAVGAACVQVARLLGAEITGVCSGANAELVKSLGATEVIDYTKTNIHGGDDAWDVVIDTVGQATVKQLCRLATPRGRIGLVSAGVPQMLAGVWRNISTRQRVLFGPAEESPTNLARLVQWLEQGAWRPVIDERLPLARGVEAHARVDSMRKVGSLVLLPSG